MMTMRWRIPLALALGFLGGPLGADPGTLTQSAGAKAPTALSAPAEVDDSLEGLVEQDLPDPAGLQELLVLSPDQKDKLRVLHLAAQEKQRAHRKRIRQLVQVLDGQVRAKAPDSDLQATLDSLQAEHRAQQLDRIDAMDQAEAVLSPSQAAQYVLHIRDEMKEGFKRWKAKRDQ